MGSKCHHHHWRSNKDVGDLPTLPGHLPKASSTICSLSFRSRSLSSSVRVTTYDRQLADDQEARVFADRGICNTRTRTLPSPVPVPIPFPFTTPPPSIHAALPGARGTAARGANSRTLLPSGPQPLLSAAWCVRSGADMEDEGEPETDDALEESRGRRPIPAVIRTRDRKRTRGDDRSGVMGTGSSSSYAPSFMRVGNHAYFGQQ
ncbi:hypothetical protein BU15DRAFT_72880 [Melanogaster broomeanus]|nr:hypothetical protein BU15DRAFT_72880 [Melanogaster broomeanus]